MRATASRTPAGRKAPRSAAVPGRAAVGQSERADLYAIIETIGSGPDLDTILRGVVRLVTEATACHACFVYFLEDDRLVLRAASDPYARFEGTVSFPLGMGLTGWVARTRRSAVIRDNALEDPRTLYVPELEEERFQSVVSVPVFSRSGDVIGVINLHTEAPREFGRGDQEFLEHTASLVAGAIENARLYDHATKRVALLTELSHLATEIASAASVADLLTTVTAGCQKALSAERAEIYLTDPGSRLSLMAATPQRDWFSLDTRALRFDPLAVDSRSSAAGSVTTLVELLWGTEVATAAGGRVLIVPLVVGGDRPGLLAVLLSARSSDALSVLSAIASHTAVALRHHELIGRLREENLVKDFFEALSREQPNLEAVASQAARLGCDLDRANLVLHATPWEGAEASALSSRRVKRAGEPVAPPFSEVVAGLETALASAFPGTVVDARLASCRALIPVAGIGESLAVGTVRQIYVRAVHERGGALAVGLSNLCPDRSGFPRVFDEAASAADVGGLMKGAPGVYTYEDLGPYRYVLSSVDAGSDRHQERLAQLVEYDRRRGSELLRTLECYLEGKGNIVGTARMLHTHPNTLRQRLGRIEQLCSFDLDDEDWLSLGIAVKIVKLRLARRSARKDSAVGENGGRRG